MDNMTQKRIESLKRIMMFLIISVFIFAGYAQANKDEINSFESTDCQYVSLVIPEANVDAPQEGFSRMKFNYFTIDLPKMQSTIISMAYPSVEIPTIDSLFSRIRNIKNELRKDVFGEYKLVSICVKINDLPLNITTDLFCILIKENMEYWAVDFRCDELFILLHNKSEGNLETKPLTKKEYKKYLQAIDLEALKEFDFYPYYRFRFANSETNLSAESEIIQKHRIKQTANFQEELKLAEKIIIDFANKEKENNTADSSAKRKTLQIYFDNDIALLRLLKIIHVAQENDLMYDCFYKRGYLNFYIRKDDDDGWDYGRVK